MISNTVTEPWAMMIHFRYTNLAYRTMMCSNWFPIIAMKTGRHLFSDFNVRNLAGFIKRRNRIAQQAHKRDKVKNKLGNLTIHL